MKRLEYKIPVLVFIGSKIFTVISALAVFLPFHREPIAGHQFWYGNTEKYHVFFELWRKWDSFFFLHIAHHGYTPGPDGIPPYFSFPFYPYLIKCLTYITHHPVLSGLIISNVSFLIALIILYNLTKSQYCHKTATHTILAISFFPLSFIFSMVYSESLFLMLCLLSFYYAFHQRWFLASLLGGLAAMTRIIGFMIVLPLFMIYLNQLKSME